MKVKELIAELQKYDGEMEVRIFDEKREDEPLASITIVEKMESLPIVIINKH